MKNIFFKINISIFFIAFTFSCNKNETAEPVADAGVTKRECKSYKKNGNVDLKKNIFHVIFI